MSFFETSAKTNQNVNEVFQFLTQEILKNNQGKTQTSGVGLEKDNKKEGKRTCCKWRRKLDKISYLIIIDSLIINYIKNKKILIIIYFIF